MAKSTKKSDSNGSESPAAKATTAAKPTAANGKAADGKMAGYIVLNRGRPLALDLGDGTPKNGVLARNERATMFTRLQGAQGAINRTGKFNEGKKGAVTPDNCQIVRIDHLPAA